MSKQTYMYGVLEDLPEDTRTLAEKQRDALLAALKAIVRTPAPKGSHAEVMKQIAVNAIAAVESGKVPT